MTTVPALLRAPLRASRAMPFARMLAVAAFGVAVGALAPAAHAQAQGQGQAQAQSSVDARSPVGLWRNIDDETKKPKALVPEASSLGMKLSSTKGASPRSTSPS